MGVENATVEVYARAMPGSMGTIALPLRDHISAQTLTSLLLLDQRFTEGRPLTYVVVQGSVLPLQRNTCIHRMQGDWILFIDDDMVFDPSAVGHLVASYERTREAFAEPIIMGGLCFRRAEPHQPTLYMRESPTAGRFAIPERWGDGVVEVDATGGAFLLIGVPALEAMMGGPMPSLDYRNGLPPWPFFEWGKGLGEDLAFCLAAKEAGVRIFVDTSLPIGHVSERVIGVRDFWRAVSERHPAVEAAHREKHDEMGLPTLSVEEAEELLRG